MKVCRFFLLIVILYFSSLSLTRDGNWLRMDNVVDNERIVDAQKYGDYLWIMSSTGIGRYLMSNKRWTFYRYDTLNFKPSPCNLSVLDSNNLAISNSDGELLIYNGNEWKKKMLPVKCGDNLTMTKDGRIWIFVWKTLYWLENDEWKQYHLDSLELSFKMTEGDSGKILYHDPKRLWSFDGLSSTCIYSGSTYGSIPQEVKKDPFNEDIWLFGTSLKKISNNTIQSFPVDTFSDSTSVSYTIDNKGYFWIYRKDNKLRWWVKARLVIDDAESEQSHFEYVNFPVKKTFDFSYGKGITASNDGILEKSVSGVYVPDDTGKWTYVSYSELSGNKPGTFENVHQLALTNDSSVLISYYPGLVSRYKNGVCKTLQTLHGVETILERKNGKIIAGCMNGVYMWADSSWEQILDVPYIDIQEDNRGTLWVLGYGNVYHEIENSTWEIFNSSNSNLPETIWKMIIGNDGTVWVMNSRCAVKTTDGINWKEYTSKLVGSNDSIVDIASGQDNKIIVVIKRDGYKKIAFFDGVSLDSICSDRTINNNSESKVFQDSKQNIWVCNEKNIIMHGKNTEIKLTYNNCPVMDTECNSISLLEDPEGRIWIGGRGGIVIYDQEIFNSSINSLRSKRNDFHIKIIPCAKSFEVDFPIEKSSKVSFSVFDMQGKMIFKTDGFFQAGSHQVPLKFKTVRGIYFVKLSSLEAVSVTKFVVK